MTLTEATKSCFRNCTNFCGRASRSEFWWFFLLLSSISFVAGNVPNWRFGNEFHITYSIGVFFGLGTAPTWPMNIYTALFFLPFIAVLARRIQNIGYAGSNIIVLPFVAYAVSMMVLKAFPTVQVLTVLNYVNFVIFACLFLMVSLYKSQPGPNKYGPNPHAATA